MWSVRLLPTLQRYIKQRQTLAGISSHEFNTLKELDLSTVIVPSTAGDLCPKKSDKHHNRTSPSPPAARIPGSVPPELSQPPATTREMLSHVAWMTEELLRASQEKVNLSQANYDSVTKPFTYMNPKIIGIRFTGGKAYPPP